MSNPKKDEMAARLAGVGAIASFFAKEKSKSLSIMFSEQASEKLGEAGLNVFLAAEDITFNISENFGKLLAEHGIQPGDLFVNFLEKLEILREQEGIVAASEMVAEIAAELGLESALEAAGEAQFLALLAEGALIGSAVAQPITIGLTAYTIYKVTKKILNRIDDDN